MPSFLFFPSTACYLGVATQCWRCFTPSPGSTPSFLCYQPACWMSPAPPHHFSLVCWLPAYPSCWSFLSRRSVRYRAYEMYMQYLPRPPFFFFNLSSSSSVYRGVFNNLVAYLCPPVGPPPPRIHRFHYVVTQDLESATVLLTSASYFQVLIVDLCADKFVVQVCTHFSA